ncbi:SGNH/GDSL hydrolase family protein [Cryobacterium sp. AP23]
MTDSTRLGDGDMMSLLQRLIRPDAFLAWGRHRQTDTVVVCAGDSITHGFMSASCLSLLQDRLGADGYEFVNAGINSDLAWNLLQRLDAIIACQLEVVTILIGTNDVAAHISTQ